MIVINHINFAADELAQVVALANKYLERKPEHKNGFCWWAAYVEDTCVYSIVGAVRELWSGGYVPDYVDSNPGPTVKRRLFVRQLRDYLVGKLALDTLPPIPARIGAPIAAFPVFARAQTKPPASVEPKHGTACHKVLDAMRCGGETTLHGISRVTNVPEATVSARIRELRNRFYWNIVTTNHRSGKSNYFTYKIV